MRAGREPDSEQQRQQARGHELMLRVGLLLLADARRVGAFATDEEELSKRLARIGGEFDDAEVVLRSRKPKARSDADYVVEVTEPKADRIGVTCFYGSHSHFAELRIDGVLENEGGGVGIVLDPRQAIPLSPAEEEVMRRAHATFAEEREHGRPCFEGAEFIRALVPSTQPGAVVRILAIELYGDGLIVQYQYDDPVDIRPTIPLSFYERAGIEPPIEELLAEAREAGGNLAPGIAVADDLGTVYRESGGHADGLQTMHGTAKLTPAVPGEASSLRVSTYAGTVTVEL